MGVCKSDREIVVGVQREKGQREGDRIFALYIPVSTQLYLNILVLNDMITFIDGVKN